MKTRMHSSTMPETSFADGNYTYSTAGSLFMTIGGCLVDNGLFTPPGYLTNNWRCFVMMFFFFLFKGTARVTRKEHVLT